MKVKARPLTKIEIGLIWTAPFGIAALAAALDLPELVISLSELPESYGVPWLFSGQ